MRIFLKRLREQWQFHIKIFRQVADWTTWLYLILPTCLVGFYFYKETILQEQFGFFIHIPYVVYVIAFFSLSSEGAMRTFVKEADLLFFIHSKQFFTLKLYAFLYSLLCNIVKFTVLYIVFQPLLFAISATAPHILLIFYSIATYLVVNIIQLMVSKKWMRTILLISNVLLMTFCYMAMPTHYSVIFLTLLLVLCMVLHIILFIQKNRFFNVQLLIEIKAYYKLQSLIFQVSASTLGFDKGKLANNRKVYFAKRTLHHNKLVDLLMKAIVRDESYVLGYCRLFFLQFPIYFLAPVGIDIVIFILLILVMKSWLTSVINEILEKPFFKLMRLSDGQLLTVQNKLLYLLIYMPFLFVGIMIVVQNTV